MSHIIHFDDATFDGEVLQSQQAVLVDFWAAWCGPCRLVGPTINAVSEKFEGQAKVGKLNIDENPETARKFGISSIPTVLIFREGQVVDKLVGVQTEEVYQAALNRVAA